MADPLASPIAKLVRARKTLAKALVEWDVAAADKALRAMESAVSDLQRESPGAQDGCRADLQRVRDELARDGYPAALEAALRSVGIPVRGEFPRFEFPPFRLEIQPREGGCVLSMGRWKKRSSCLEPTALARFVEKHYRKLADRKLDLKRFAVELRRAYESSSARTLGQKQPGWGHPVSLRGIYELLTLRAESRKDYSLETFIHDLGRYRAAGQVHDGHVHSYGFSRDAKDALVFIDEHGREERIATISIIPESAP